MFGGRVILFRRFDAGETLAMVRRERPTVMFMVPTMFQLVAEQPAFEETDFSSLRWAISGGAPLPERIAEQWRHKVPIFKQGYGLTEVGPNNFATPDEDAERKRGTVGRLTYVARARIVDDAGADVPEGTAGELLLAGPHMCAGYWRRPEATAAAFRDGWFRTGDLATRSRDGRYALRGRRGDLIISGGFNVYPREIEELLLEDPRVREATVVGMPDAARGEVPIAYVCADDTLDVTELERLCRSQLASFKIPRVFVRMDALPRTALGKVQKHLLPPPGEASARAAARG
jgi:acyl-CoA synthetase (AMP-forming)/AMP-acid ligase II